uniref:Uncharacterized protein n=1 Tax=Timema tahoe TaxID=61484 RepID=A0A7R9ID16_9NEOP|nr:unnamed protein product [Timema tahoe]
MVGNIAREAKKEMRGADNRKCSNALQDIRDTGINVILDEASNICAATSLENECFFEEKRAKKRKRLTLEESPANAGFVGSRYWRHRACGALDGSNCGGCQQSTVFYLVVLTRAPLLLIFPPPLPFLLIVLIPSWRFRAPTVLRLALTRALGGRFDHHNTGGSWDSLVTRLGDYCLGGAGTCAIRVVTRRCWYLQFVNSPGAPADINPALSPKHEQKTRTGSEMQGKILQKLIISYIKTPLSTSVMPPRKEPWSLYKTSIRYVLNMIGEACFTMEKRYGNYDHDKCREQIVIFQEYLAYNLPSTILDELWDVRRFVTETNLKNDHRILTAVSMHRNMLKFIVNHESYKFKVCGDNSFWMTQLSRLNNLVVLDLYLACTDEILKVVGKCCPKLEQIDIVSKMEADHTYADGNNLFNALKIKFFVSDNGLLHLSNCKKLKVIYMNKMIRSQSAGRVVSKSGIRQLIKALPNIEFVSYNDMGLVIAQEMDDVGTLSLRRIIDQHPDISHIFAAARLCPKLDNLSLCFPTFENAVGSHVKILNALAESTINSTTLELIMFPIGDSFFSLLVLTYVVLTDSSQLTSDGFEKLPDQIMYPYAAPYDLQKTCL